MPKDMHTKKIIRKLQNKNKKDEVIFMAKKVSNMSEWKIISDIGAANTANTTSQFTIETVFEREPNSFQCIYEQGRIMERRDVIRYGG